MKGEGPVLDRYLARNMIDQHALFAAIYAQYYAVSATQSLALEADRAKLKRYASAYKGTNEALVARYLQSMGVR